MKPAKRPTRRQRRDALRKAAEAVFLEFYEGSSWAHDKLRSGTASLEPEAITYMQGELVRRKDAAQHAKDLADQNKAFDMAERVAANAE